MKSVMVTQPKIAGPIITPTSNCPKTAGKPMRAQ